MNIYDVAKHAGVSTATVSRVINTPSSVNVKTKEKVLKSIAELKYTPNAIARGLATKSTKTIGVMVPDVRDPFHANASFILEQLLNKEGYSTILCNTTADRNAQYNYFELLFSQQVDGIIALGSIFTDEKLIDQIQLVNSKIPVILLNNVAPDVVSVQLNVDTGIKEALEYLKSIGKSNIAYVKHDLDYQTRASTNKEISYIKNIEEIFKVPPKIYEVSGDDQSFIDLLDQLKKDKAVDGLFIEKDTLAMKFLRYGTRSGISIPNDMSIVGFDNLDLTDISYLSISTIDHEIDKMCNLSVDLLIKLLKGEKIENYINVVDSAFIPKETT